MNNTKISTPMSPIGPPPTPNALAALQLRVNLTLQTAMDKLEGGKEWEEMDWVGNVNVRSGGGGGAGAGGGCKRGRRSAKLTNNSCASLIILHFAVPPFTPTHPSEFRQEAYEFHNSLPPCSDNVPPNLPLLPYLHPVPPPRRYRARGRERCFEVGDSQD